MQKDVEVIIERIVVNNFRKVAFLDIALDPKMNWLVGTNEVGKSTIANGHSWLWSQYDMDNLEAYEIKPKAEDGTTPYKNVSGFEEHLLIRDRVAGDEYRLIVRRELVDIWDDETDTLKGNEQVFYLDGVKTKTKTAFMEAINKIVDVDTFRIISSPTYFLTMKNEDMRKRILELIGGDLSDADLLALKPEYEKLIEILKKQSIEDYFKTVKQSLSAAEKQKLGLPAAFNEVKLAISKLPTMEQFKELEASLEAKRKELDAVELELKGLGDDPATVAADKLKVELGKEEESLKLLISKFNNELATKNSLLEAKRIPLRSKISTANTEISTLKASITDNEKKLADLKIKFDGLTAKWHEIDKEEFVEPEVGAICPKCKKPYTQEEVDAMLDTAEGDFNTDKADRKAEVTEASKALLPTKTALETAMNTAKDRIPVLEQEVKTTQEQLDAIKPDESKVQDDPNYQALSARIDELKVKLATPAEPTEAVPNTELADKKQLLVTAIEELNQQVGKKAVLESNNERMTQLLEDEMKINISVLAWKKAKHIVESYLKDKSSVLEEKVNKEFDLVQFQLFEFTQEGTPKLVCIPKVNGAYFPVVNRAGKIRAHIDVAKTFGRKYGVTLPLFIDNKESVVKGIPEVDNQVIFLKVDENFPTLTHLKQ